MLTVVKMLRASRGMMPVDRARFQTTRTLEWEKILQDLSRSWPELQLNHGDVGMHRRECRRDEFVYNHLQVVGPRTGRSRRAVQNCEELDVDGRKIL